MSLKIPLQLYDASPKNIVDLTDLENHRVQSKGRITYISHSCFFFVYYFYTENSLYAYSLEDLCSTVVGVEVKHLNFQPDSHWVKHVDHATHRLSLLRCEVVLEAGGVGGAGVPDRMAWWDFVLSWLCEFWTRSTSRVQDKGWC